MQVNQVPGAKTAADGSAVVAETDPGKQFVKARVTPERIELGVDPQFDQPRVARPEGGVEGLERPNGIVPLGVDLGLLVE